MGIRQSPGARDLPFSHEAVREWHATDATHFVTMLQDGSTTPSVRRYSRIHRPTAPSADPCLCMNQTSRSHISVSPYDVASSVAPANACPSRPTQCSSDDRSNLACSTPLRPPRRNSQPCIDHLSRAMQRINSSQFDDADARYRASPQFTCTSRALRILHSLLFLSRAGQHVLRCVLGTGRVHSAST